MNTIQQLPASGESSRTPNVYTIRQFSLFEFEKDMDACRTIYFYWQASIVCEIYILILVVCAKYLDRCIHIEMCRRPAFPICARTHSLIHSHAHIHTPLGQYCVQHWKSFFKLEKKMMMCL